ncbi:hypothetical protein ACI2UK_24475 [Ralstonia nicotianae]|uniref:hypothetical protein n=1 Tax=Ralstonia pseudosolanacearum TaxID=1310165 RepID=UPI002002E525|nr:hypothetical protein [Ralstonia pseudosolanacearum]MCK4120403.1 hypothetical protein [Ralstonia pseudosolanacearum]
MAVSHHNGKKGNGEGTMEQGEIRVGRRYEGTRWQGAREVVRIVPGTGANPAVVHYLDMRTGRTGNAELRKFAGGASCEVSSQ